MWGSFFNPVVLVYFLSLSLCYLSEHIVRRGGRAATMFLPHTVVCGVCQIFLPFLVSLHSQGAHELSATLQLVIITIISLPCCYLGFLSKYGVYIYSYSSVHIGGKALAKAKGEVNNFGASVS